jgi:hypothetical protein
MAIIKQVARIARRIYLNKLGIFSIKLPPTPTGVSSVPVTDTQIAVFINNVTSSNETTFEWERSLNGVSGWVLAGTTGMNIWYFYDTGLTKATLYYYRVRARNAAGYSGYSSIATAVTFYTESSDYFIAAGITDYTEQAAANNFIGYLVDNGAWGLLDRLWLVSITDKSAALRCAKSLTSLADAFDDVVYDPQYGFMFTNQGTEYLEDSQDFDDADEYTLNLASHFIFITDQDGDKGAFFGTSVGTIDSSNQATGIYQDSTPHQLSWSTDTQTLAEYASGAAINGLYHTNVISSAAADHDLYVDGVLEATAAGSTVATLLSPYPLHIHGVNEDGVNANFRPGFYWIGGGYGKTLDEACSVADFYDKFRTYQLEIGRSV